MYTATTPSFTKPHIVLPANGPHCLVVWIPPFFAGWCPPRSQWIIDDNWLIIIDDCWWLLMMIEWMIDDYSTLSAVLGCKIAIHLWMLAHSLLSNHHFSLKIVMNGRYTLFFRHIIESCGWLIAVSIIYPQWVVTIPQLSHDFPMIFPIKFQNAHNIHIPLYPISPAFQTKSPLLMLSEWSFCYRFSFLTPCHASEASHPGNTRNALDRTLSTTFWLASQWGHNP